jgi:hypothetical protein
MTISYDFDGVLHLDVDGIHPFSYTEVGLTPSVNMFEKFKSDLGKKNAVIITARHNSSINVIRSFLELNGIDEHVHIIATSGGEKAPYIRRLSVEKHYDDNVEILFEFDDDSENIEIVIVSNDKEVESISTKSPIHEKARIMSKLFDTETSFDKDSIFNDDYHGFFFMGTEII